MRGRGESPCLPAVPEGTLGQAVGPAHGRGVSWPSPSPAEASAVRPAALESGAERAACVSSLQLLQLLLAQDKLTARQFQRVAVTTILAVARQHPQLAEKHLLRPMLEPLLRCADVAGRSFLPLSLLSKGARGLGGGGSPQLMWVFSALSRGVPGGQAGRNRAGERGGAQQLRGKCA